MVYMLAQQRAIYNQSTIIATDAGQAHLSPYPISTFTYLLLDPY